MGLNNMYNIMYNSASKANRAPKSVDNLVNNSYLAVKLKLIFTAVARFSSREGDGEGGEECVLQMHVLLGLLQLFELRVTCHHAVESLLKQ